MQVRGPIAATAAAAQALAQIHEFEFLAELCRKAGWKQAAMLAAAANGDGGNLARNELTKGAALRGFPRITVAGP